MPIDFFNRQPPSSQFLTHNSNITMPVTKFTTPEKYKYQNGFGSYHESSNPFRSQKNTILTTKQIRSHLRRPPHRSQLPPKASLRPLRRKALWHSIHSTPAREPTNMALPNPPLRRPLPLQPPRSLLLQHEPRRRQNASNPQPITLGSLRFGRISGLGTQLKASCRSGRPNAQAWNWNHDICSWEEHEQQ